MSMVIVQISKGVSACLGKYSQKVKEEEHKLITCFCREIQPTVLVDIWVLPTNIDEPLASQTNNSQTNTVK